MSKNILLEYEMPLQITSYDTDAEDNLRLSAILRYQQEAAEQHLSAMDMGWIALAEHNLAFVTSRWHARIYRLPTMGERVVLTTWHRERKGPRFLRCYQWADEEGNLLIEGVMQFALVSVQSHRLLRGEEFDIFGLPDQPQRDVRCPDPSKFSMPDLRPCFHYTVRRSDIDRNQHMNNTRYGDLLYDSLEDAGLRMTDVALYFAGEATLGDTIALSAATDANTGYVRGQRDGRTVFEGRVTYAAK